MGMSVGGVQFPESVIELEQRVFVLEEILQIALSGKPVVQSDIDEAKIKALDMLQRKYPELGISTI